MNEMNGCVEEDERMQNKQNINGENNHIHPHVSTIIQNITYLCNLYLYK